MAMASSAVDDDASMASASSSRSPSPSPTPAPLDSATLRAQGNDLFKSKAYGSALDKYTAAIDLQEAQRIARRKAKSNGSVSGNANVTPTTATLNGSSTQDDDDGLASLYLNRAAALMALNRHSKAVDDCRRSIEVQQQVQGEASVKSQLRLCRALIGCGRLEEAQSRLKSLPPSDETRSLCSSLQPLLSSWSAVQREVASGELRMASFAIEQLLTSPLVPCPPLSWKILSLSLLYIRNDSSLQQASSKVTDLLRTDPSHPEILLLRARVFFAQGELTKTIQHLQAALRNDPDLAAARELLRFTRSIEKLKEEGNKAAKEGRWNAARERYTEALQALGAEKDDKVGETQVNGDDDDDAPASSSTTSSKGGISNLHLTEGGSRQLRAVLYSNRATANLKLKAYESALSDCNTTLSLIPSYSKATRTRARANLALDLFDDAIRDFQEALETSSSSSSGPAGETQQLKRELQQAQMLKKRSLRKDHYKTLGVKRDAEDNEIKRAYRVASLKHHPDKGGDEAKFKEIGEAYNILSDPVKRRRYDCGAEDPEVDSPSHHHHHHPFGGAGGVDLSELFGQGGMGGGGGFHPAGFGAGGAGAGGGFGGMGGGARGGQRPSSSFHFG